MTDIAQPRMAAEDYGTEYLVTPPEPVRVRFGPGKSQTMPVEWAEHILTALAEDKTRFGKFLTDAALAAR